MQHTIYTVVHVQRGIISSTHLFLNEHKARVHHKQLEQDYNEQDDDLELQTHTLTLTQAKVC